MSWNNPPLRLYHGTTRLAADGIVAAGPSERKFRPGTDFGPGFYTTTNLEQARKWAALKSRIIADQAAVVRLEVDRDALSRVESMAFVRAASDTDDYWNFVRSCRDGAVDHARLGACSKYDVVIGPVAQIWHSRPYCVLGGSDQVSFHTPAGLALLRRAIVLGF